MFAFFPLQVFCEDLLGGGRIKKLMQRTKQEFIYREWQKNRNKISLENVEKFYQIEKELYEKAVESINLLEMENPVMVRNSQRQKLIESRSRCFAEINKGASLESIVERLANLTKAIQI